MVNTSCLLFLRDIHEGYVSLQVADDGQSKFAHEIKNIDEDKKSVEKKFFVNNIGLFLTGREVFNNFKNRLFPFESIDQIQTPKPKIKPESEPDLEIKPQQPTQALNQILNIQNLYLNCVK